MKIISFFLTSIFQVNLVKKKFCKNKRKMDICAKSSCQDYMVGSENGPGLVMEDSDSDTKDWTLVGIEYQSWRRKYCSEKTKKKDQHEIIKVADSINWIREIIEADGSFLPNSKSCE